MTSLLTFVDAKGNKSGLTIHCSSVIAIALINSEFWKRMEVDFIPFPTPDTEDSLDWVNISDLIAKGRYKIVEHYTKDKL